MDRVSSAINPLAMARDCGVQVEAESLRSETTQVFAQPDGLLRAEIAGGRVRMRTGDRWVDVDLTLERRADASVGSRSHPFDLRLSGGMSGETPGRTHDLVTTRSATRHIGYGWTGAAARA